MSAAYIKTQLLPLPKLPLPNDLIISKNGVSDKQDKPTTTLGKRLSDT